MTCMVRQLPATAAGLPLELYFLVPNKTGLHMKVFKPIFLIIYMRWHRYLIYVCFNIQRAMIGAINRIKQLENNVV